MWIMTTDFSELTPRQTRRVVRFTEPMFLTRSSPRADWRDAKLRGKTLFVVRHFVTLMAGTARACSAVFETCRPVGNSNASSCSHYKTVTTPKVPKNTVIKNLKNLSPNNSDKCLPNINQKQFSLLLLLTL